MFAVVMVRKAEAAEDSLAAIRERNKFGTAIAAMIKMIATTINNSISENPFSFLNLIPSLSVSSVSNINFPNSASGIQTQELTIGYYEASISPTGRHRVPECILLLY